MLFLPPNICFAAAIVAKTVAAIARMVTISVLENLIKRPHEFNCSYQRY